MSRTTPREVKENTKTIAAAEAIAGRSAESVTVRKAVQGPAPRLRAVSSIRGSIVTQRAPTIRTTTARFK